MFSRILPIALAGSLFFWACTEKGKESAAVVYEGALADRHRIDSLEKIIAQPIKGDTNGTEYMRQVLETLRAYQNYTVDYPKDTATATYLFKSGKVYYSYLKDLDNAEEYLNHLVDSFPAARDRPMGLLVLGSLYQDKGDTAEAMANLRILEREYANTEYNRMSQEMIDYIRRTTPPKVESGDQPPLGQEPKIQ